VYSNRKPEDISSSTDSFATALQLEQHLSPTRSNGLSAMLKAIHGFAEDALA
jgi:cysteine desulfuration protein SufE